MIALYTAGALLTIAITVAITVRRRSRPVGAASLGAPVSKFGLLVLTLVAALPSASNVLVLAERYGADNGRVTRIILASSVLAFASFSVLAWLFGVGDAPE